MSGAPQRGLLLLLLCMHALCTSASESRALCKDNRDRHTIRIVFTHSAVMCGPSAKCLANSAPPLTRGAEWGVSSPAEASHFRFCRGRWVSLVIFCSTPSVTCQCFRLSERTHLGPLLGLMKIGAIEMGARPLWFISGLISGATERSSPISSYQQRFVEYSHGSGAFMQVFCAIQAIQ